jgi:hypothetical protein
MRTWSTLLLWMVVACDREDGDPDVHVPPEVTDVSPQYRARIVDRPDWIQVVAVDVDERGTLLAGGQRRQTGGQPENVLVIVPEGGAPEVQAVSFTPAGLDDDGTVVGTRESGDVSTAVLWKDGASFDLAGPRWSRAFGVRSGVVAGECEALGRSHACVWTEDEDWRVMTPGVAFDVAADGSIVGLGPVPGGAFVGLATGEVRGLIQDDRCGRAVGISPGGRYVVVAEKNREAGYLFDVDPPGGGWRGQKLAFLPRAVQDDGLVVGVDTRSGWARAVVSDPAADWIQPLETLVQPEALGGARVVDAVAIGSVGQVAGTVRKPDGTLRPALFVPVRPVPGAGAELPPIDPDFFARSAGSTCY